MLEKIKFVTKLFKNSSLKISFKTENIIRNFPNNKNINPNKFNNCGIYQLICHDCKRKYIGKTRRQFYIWFQVYFHGNKHGNRKSKFSHLLDNIHYIGSVEDIMEILHITRKSEMMNTLERFHVYNENKLDYQINDMCTIKHNEIFKTIGHRNTCRGHCAIISYTSLGLVQSQVTTQYASLPIHRKQTVSGHIRSHRHAVHIFVKN